MINYEVYEQEIEKGNIKNGYIFCGLDEEFIKDGISLIIKKNIAEEFMDLNLIRIDGMNTSFDAIMNACEQCHSWEKKKLWLFIGLIFYKTKLIRQELKYTMILRAIYQIYLHIQY